MGSMTAAEYRTPAVEVQTEIEIKRSRFICTLAPASDEEAARAVISRIRAAHPKSRHNCSAFVLGPDSATMRSSDDGEPSGTAGTPMLDVLLGHRLTYVVAVVTRYFGGTLLGSGGLVRAYGQSVSEAVARASIARYGLRVPVTVQTGYAPAAALEADFRRSGWPVIDAVYGADVRLTVAVEPPALDAAVARIADLTAGSALTTVGEPFFAELAQRSP